MDDSIGALWAKKTRNGDDFFTGSIELNGEKTNIVVFYNKSKIKNEKAPDYRILIAKPQEPKDNQEELNNLGQEEDVNPDDIPF